MSKLLSTKKKYVLATYKADSQYYANTTWLFNADDFRLAEGQTDLDIIGDATPVGKTYSRGPHRVRDVVAADGKEFVVYLGDRSAKAK